MAPEHFSTLSHSHAQTALSGYSGEGWREEEHEFESKISLVDKKNWKAGNRDTFNQNTLYAYTTFSIKRQKNIDSIDELNQRSQWNVNYPI